MKRFSKKLDHIFWFCVSILPIFLFLVYSLFFNGVIANLGEVSEVIIGASFTEFINYFNFFKWEFAYDILTEIFSNNLFSIPDVLAVYLSWCCAVEVVHVLFDFIVFIPRVAHKFLGGLYHNE